MSLVRNASTVGLGSVQKLSTVRMSPVQSNIKAKYIFALFRGTCLRSFSEAGAMDDMILSPKWATA